ncbi:c-type cytochrome biogenesis protein CcmI [Chenggangzhangella methanolivorans]|nr:c-type cytochrome biogenesis protein CcmI [Chenggangzhangella methanolivorans]
MGSTMALWLIFAVMTGAAVFVVLGSLARSRTAGADGSEADAAVYRDQIDEIARDRSRGLIDEREAESARVEVARRLIAASERGGDAPASASTGRRRIAAALSLVAIPAIGLGVYASLGKPNLPDLPLAARKTEAPDGANVADLAARVETALAKNPNDGRGWSVIAPIYLRLGRPADAATAYANAIRLLGATPDREANLGEALFAAADGVVTAQARAAFERSVEGPQPSIKGTFYLARAAEQDGDLAGAFSRLKLMFANAPQDAPYLEALKEEFQRMADVPALQLPTGDEAATLKTPEEREAFIRKMVEGLDQRLSADGGDLGEWLRLVRSRVALGEVDKARDALAKAREKFGADGRAAVRLEALALGLGLEGRGA